MLEIIIVILSIILVTFSVLAGADLGTGIIELFKSKRDDYKQYSLSIHALKPVWEINHIWLGLATIIIFLVFPKIFYQIFTTFAFPILFVFIGLFMRGFTFSLKSSQKYMNHKQLNLIFDLSSIWSTFWIGNLVGAIIQGKVTLNPNSFYDAYVGPWLSLFPILTGLFLITLFAFIASIFLHTETDDKLLHDILRKRAMVANALAIVIGSFIFLKAFYLNEGLTFYFLQSPISLLSLGLATLLLIPNYLLLKFNKKFLLRLLTSSQIFLILLGLFGAQFPIIMQTNLDDDPKTFTFYNSVAENTSVEMMFTVVLIALFITIPTYLYLFRIYKKKLSNPF